MNLLLSQKATLQSDNRASNGSGSTSTGDRLMTPGLSYFFFTRKPYYMISELMTWLFFPTSIILPALYLAHHLWRLIYSFQPSTLMIINIREFKVIKFVKITTLFAALLTLTACTGRIENKSKSCSYDYLLHPAISISKIIGGCGPADETKK